jgi:hypothetical protein
MCSLGTKLPACGEACLAPSDGAPGGAELVERGKPLELIQRPVSDAFLAVKEDRLQMRKGTLLLRLFRPALQHPIVEDLACGGSRASSQMAST